MIRRYFLLLIGVTLLVFCAMSQNTGNSFTLNQPINTNGENVYTASNYILLQPGFSMQANSAKSFTANIGGIITVPTGDITGGSEANNEGGVVGEIPLHFHVNETGAAICNVPFDLPPGLNGLTPELGLNYNSQRTGEGIMGDGWGIQGVSAISKVPWNYYYNEGSSSIQFSFEDQLMYDGQYLIKTGNEYRTEKESFDKIVLFDGVNLNNGFKVFKPNGLVYYYGTDSNNYGNTFDSRLCLQNGVPIAWYLEKIEDVNGNTIEYTYLKDAINDGTIHLLYVYYGGNPSQNISHKYRLQFNYLDHNGGLGFKKYFTSVSTNNINYTFDTKELKSVVLRYSESGEPFSTGTEIWKYTLVYPLKEDTYTDKRQLEKILFTQSGQKYNPLKFEWQGNDGEHSLQQSVLSTTSIQYKIPAPQDENQIQLIPFRHKEPYSTSAHLDHLMCYYVSGMLNVFQWYYNTSLGVQAPGNMNTFSLENTHKLHTFTVGYIVGFKIWDIDNDGDDEIVYIKWNNPGYAIHVVEIGGAVPVDRIVKTISYFDSDWFMFGDFDGNGYLDLAYRKSGDNEMIWMMSDEDGLFHKIYTSSPNFKLLGNIRSYYSGRFSGAQKDELIFFVQEQYGNKTYYVGLKPTTSGVVIPEKVEITGDASYSIMNAIANKSCFTGDFNNDGKTDFLFIEGSTIIIYLSAGKGIFVKENVGNQPLAGLPWNEHPRWYAITDANGDGYDDLIAITTETILNSSNSYEVHYYRQDFLLSPLSGNYRFLNQWGDHKIEIKPYSSDVIFDHNPLQEQRLHLLRGNFIGTSSNHLLVAYFDAYKKEVYCRLTGIYPQYGHLIKKITGSMGDVTTIDYAPISDRVSTTDFSAGEPPFAYYRGNECG